MTSTSRIAVLEISTWIGISPGASHYMGVLRFRGQKTDLSSQLTAAEAYKVNVALNKDREGGEIREYFRAGDTYTGYTDRDVLIQQAIDEFQEIYPEAELLLLGNSAVVSPQRPLAGPRNDFMLLLDLYHQWEALGGWDFGDSPAADLVNERWHEIYRRYER